MAKPARKIDPFKTRKVREAPAQEADTVTPPKDVARHIDEFRAAQEQAKHFEGEATIHKDAVMAYSNAEFTKRLFNGMDGSFKILGEESMVTYVSTEASAGLTEEDVAEVERQWGKHASEELIVRDYGSIRFDAAVLEANYEAVVEALQTLPPEVLDNLFRPMLMKAKPGAVELAKKYAKNPEQMQDMLRALKIKNYIR